MKQYQGHFLGNYKAIFNREDLGMLVMMNVCELPGIKRLLLVGDDNLEEEPTENVVYQQWFRSNIVNVMVSIYLQFDKNQYFLVSYFKILIY